MTVQSSVMVADDPLLSVVGWAVCFAACAGGLSAWAKQLPMTLDIVGLGYDLLFFASLSIPVVMTYFLVDHMAAAGVTVIMIFMHLAM